MSKLLTGKRSLNMFGNGASKKTKVAAKPITEFFKKSSTSTTTEKEEGKEKVKDVVCKVAITPITELSEFKKQFISKLADEQKELLDLEINTMEDSWFQALSAEFLKPYFIELKKFLKAQYAAKQTIFPPQNDIYSWSRLTPLNNVKVIILGQDPYHNFNQAHGLAFSVKAPTPPPPSLKNIYKGLKIDYPDFVIPSGDGAGDLTKWASRGVLLLNACLTVKAHDANSHSKKGWEQFTEVVLKNAIENDKNIVILLWGTPAQKRIENIKIDPQVIHVLKCVHPSPLSARRGFFEAGHFKKTNQWLSENGEKPIDWALMESNVIGYTK